MNSSNGKRHVISLMPALILTVCAVGWWGIALAQNAATTSNPINDQGAIPNILSPGGHGSIMQSGQTATATQGDQTPINATLLAQPSFGRAPLTVDFIVSASANASRGGSVYQWNFGDGGESSLPAGAYVSHVYRQAGTYFCSLTIVTSGARSTTIFASIRVQPHQG